MQDKQSSPLPTHRGSGRAQRPLFITLSLGLALSACDGCSHRGRAPISYLGPKTEVVIELAREDLLSQLSETLPKDFAGVMSPEEQKHWQESLKARLGFDPTTVKGLKEAGLDPDAPMAAGLNTAAKGSLLAVIPVTDAAKFQPILDSALKSHFQAEPTQAETYKGAKIQGYGVSFGTRTVRRAAYAFRDKVLLLGFGEDAAARVKAAIDQDPKAGIAQQAVFQGWVKQIGDDWVFRAIATKVGPLLKRNAGQAIRAFPQRKLSEVLSQRIFAHMTSLGYSVSANKRALGLRGGVSLDEEGAATLKRWTKGIKKTPEALFAGPQGEAFLEGFARLDLLYVLNDIDGANQAGAAPGALNLRVGMKDLKNVHFRELAASAAPALWGTVATTAPEAFAGMPLPDRPSRLPPGFRQLPAQLQLQKKPQTTPTMTKGSPFAKLANRLGGAYFTKDGVSFLATTKKAEAGLRAKPTGADPLDGAPGWDLSLYPARLADGLSTLPPEEIPLMFRVMASRALQALAWVERVHLQMIPKDKELLFTGELEFSERVKASK